jgi:hypothetical protein
MRRAAWADETMNELKYIEASVRLAELLGWKPSINPAGITEWLHPHTGLPAPLPDWLGDDGTTYRLALEQGLKLDFTDTDERFICYVHLSSRRDAGYFAEHYDDHKSKSLSYEEAKALTSRYCVCIAAIAKLEAKLEQKAKLDMAL